MRVKFVVKCVPSRLQTRAQKLHCDSPQMATVDDSIIGSSCTTSDTNSNATDNLLRSRPILDRHRLPDWLRQEETCHIGCAGNATLLEFCNG